MPENSNDTLTPRILARAREILARGWTRGHLARTADRVPVPVDCPRAVQFCLEGAVRRSALDLAGSSARSVLLEPISVLREQLFLLCSPGFRPNEDSLTAFNDTQLSAEPVLQLLDAALAKYRK